MSFGPRVSVVQPSLMYFRTGASRDSDSSSAAEADTAPASRKTVSAPFQVFMRPPARPRGQDTTRSRKETPDEERLARRSPGVRAPSPRVGRGLGLDGRRARAQARRADAHLPQRA